MMRKLVTMREALESPQYFGALLTGNSWQAWCVLLIAIVGETLTDEERAVFKTLTDRDSEPLEPVEEFWAVHWTQRRQNTLYGRPGGLFGGLLGRNRARCPAGEQKTVRLLSVVICSVSGHALVECDPCVALDHGVLHFDCATYRVDHAPELEDAAVTSALDDAAMVHGDCGVNQIAAERPQPRQNPILVCPSKPRIADHVGHHYRRELSSLAHGAARLIPPARLSNELSCNPTGISISGVSMAAHPCCTREGVEAGSAGPACRLAGLSTRF